ncbi:putative aldouronate transport system permease protein [Paenibacillus sp. UNCCL117]|uniref:ABC transporter permease n=1 Tax=unclassified Paenibacillus TaxID=185978 RepID=UPI00088DB362|nr:MULTISPECIES: ABC transporter permease subunit [unclassified Paenibacillus]SDD04877.1 putative aldouronate transport system permease protein [Paenibacillus sp. cl123]SFW31984.1 putative aldouronate transport system permease protein [Paenibacillus sp. UNCCL117]
MKTPFIRDLIEYKTLLLMLLPALLFVLLFQYTPMFGLVLAFKEYTYTKGILGSDWVGLNNFRFFFISGDAWRVTRNTVLYNAAFISINLVLQVGVAIMLSEIRNRWFKKVSQTLMFLPFFISWVVVGTIAYNLLNFEHGTVNSLFRAAGMEPVNFYSTPDVWPFLLIIFNAWKAVGYGAVFYLAAIMSIDQEMFEAAETDGANVFQRIWYITIPCLKPTMMILILLAVGQIFRGDFGLFFNMVGSNGLLFSATDVIDTFVYRSLVENNEIGMSAAIDFFQSVLCFVTILLVNGIVRRTDKDSALF